jgi:hypothetical protein
MGTSRGKNTPTTKFPKRRKSYNKTKKRIDNNNELLRKLKEQL